MKAFCIIAGITIILYLAVMFVYSCICFIYDLFTKDESQIYEEYWKQKDNNSDTK